MAPAQSREKSRIRETPVKLAISGKGGVGKTTVAAALARSWVQAGRKVFVIDADPDANLAVVLGFPPELTPKPIGEMKELIEERTEAKMGVAGQMFKLNPRVDDVPDSFAAKHAGVSLMVMGKVKSGGAGCVCPENAFLKALMHHLVVERNEVLILDMVAGTEHLGRGTAAHVDALVILAEPTLPALETARRAAKLGSQLGIKRSVFVGNKVRRDSDRDFIASGLAGANILGFLPFSEAVEASSRGIANQSQDLQFESQLEGMRRRLDAFSVAAKSDKP